MGLTEMFLLLFGCWTFISYFAISTILPWPKPLFDAWFHVKGCWIAPLSLRGPRCWSSFSASLDMGRMELSALWMDYQRSPTSGTVPITRSLQIISVIFTSLDLVQLQIVSRAKETWYPYPDYPPILAYVSRWCHYFDKGQYAQFNQKYLWNYACSFVTSELT